MSIRITARPERGIRRVGVLHPAAAVVYPDEYFDSEEIEVLKNDPDLIVELLDDELLTAGERAHHLHLVRENMSDPAATGDAELRPSSSSAGESQPDAGHAPTSTPTNGLAAEQSAAAGEGLTDDPSATRDMILLLGDFDVQDAALLLEIVSHWTPEERLAVEQYCAAAHLNASDHDDVDVPSMPIALQGAFADIQDARAIRKDEAEREAKRAIRKRGK